MKKETATQAPHILIVDDEPHIRTVLSRTLQAVGYRCHTASSVAHARHNLSQDEFQMVLLDIRMPEQSGLALLEEIAPRAPDTIALMITAEEEVRTAVRALTLGAYDYILKPFDLEALRHAVRRARERQMIELENRNYKEQLEGLVEERTRLLTQSLRDLATTRLGLIRGICLVAEFRAPETGAHLERMAAYSREIALELQRREAGGEKREAGEQKAELVDEEFIESLYESAPLHDVGKVGIPDAILLKPESLTPTEFEVMKQHTLLGRDIVAGVRKHLGAEAASFLAMAQDVCAYHHEAWDGTGYPYHLAGEEIPLSARIIAVADFYDATTWPRIYRPEAMTHEEVRGMLIAASGKKFDPSVIDAFLATEQSILATKAKISN
jgi:putative two-component system response regulator